MPHTINYEIIKYVAKCHVFPMSSVNAKSPQTSGRLNVRLSPDIKARIQRAANILGQDLTEFTSTVLNKHAKDIIENHDQILLSEKDYDFFVEALDRPVRKPSARSKRALEKYRQMFKNNSSL